MQFTTRAHILGAKRSKGEVEGTAYDFTELYVVEGLDVASGNAVGNSAQAYKWGTSQNFDQLKHHKFPLEVEIDFMTVTNGRGASRNTITGLRPQVKA